MPITDPTALAVDPAMEPERRIQSLFHAWIRNYFTGASFQTKGPNGTTVSKTFTHCDIGWQEDVLPENASRPIIHCVIPDRSSTRRDFARDQYGHDERWMIEIMIRVPHNLTGTTMQGQVAEHVVRRVADQLAWLLSSVERNDLAEVGIHETTLTRPPAILPAGAWLMRLMIASARTRRELPR